MVRRTAPRLVPALLVLAGCASSPRFTTTDRSPLDSDAFELSGIASYYADEFNGRKTASGEVFDMNDLTAAHRTLPFNTRLKVRNLENGKEVVVRVNDRGPFAKDRIIDLSLEAAKRVGMIASGTAPVVLEILELGHTP